MGYYVLQIEGIFQQEGIVKPVGFTQEDVNLDAPKLLSRQAQQ